MYGWLPEVCDDTSQVVTASRRLARLLTHEYNDRQIAAGKRAWLTPVIVAWPDWLARLYASGGPGARRARLNAHQSRVLWERILDDEISDPLVNVPGLTRHARDAWKRLHEWQVPFDECAGAASTRDQHVFASAASRYRERLREGGWIDDATLCAAVAAAAGDGRLVLPERLLLAGFDRLTPEAEGMVRILRDRGTQVTMSQAPYAGSDAVVTACADPDAELRSAGAWARQELEGKAGLRVGIVVSGLEQDAQRAGRLVREGLVPGWQYGGGSQRSAANVSFGRRLHGYPAIEIALLLLGWARSPISGRDLSVLLRSPFLGASHTDGRARLEAALRRMPDRDWTPELLTRAFGGGDNPDDAADWLVRLRRFAEVVQSQPNEAPPAAWAALIDGLLEDFGWPGAAALESADFQLVNRWRDLLNDLARLDLVVPRMSLGQAVLQLRAMATDTVFQPEMEGAVVEVLGPLEAAGLEFDRLWITGLSASQWPPAGRPTALISRRLQRHYGMPDADPDDTTAYARRVIDRLLGSAARCICSYPTHSNDAIETVTALIEGAAPEPVRDDPGWHARTLCGRSETVALADDPVPPVAPEESVAGGAATLQRQIDEPFGAFAQGRLGISILRPIEPGLSPVHRGNLIHGAAFNLYRDLPAQADVLGWSADELDDRVEAAVNRAFGRYERFTDRKLRELLALERQRDSRLLLELVQSDLARAPFRVDALEAATELVLSGVRFRLRVDRVDRYDDGSVAILDYKTGSRRKFLDRHGEPIDAQLIVYAIAASARVSALGFYNIDSRATALDASGRDAMGEEAWQEALERWTQEVERAAAGFAAGDVRIRYWQTQREARELNLLSRFGELRRDA